MAFTVRNILQMKEFEAFTLVAGENGLDRPVSDIGILDYEYANEDPQLQAMWPFGRETIVISSLLFAKEHPERILSAVRGLCHDGASVLAVKTIYYKELPAEVIDYANEHALPILLFGRDDAYFQNIVLTINSKIEEAGNFELQEKKIGMLLSRTLGRMDEIALARELAPDVSAAYCVAYYTGREDGGWFYDRHKNAAVFNSMRNCDCVYRYQNGYLLLVLLDEKKGGDPTQQMLKRLRIPHQNAVIGISQKHASVEELNFAFDEALFAAQYARRQNEETACFSALGLYQLLLPYHRDPWMRGFVDRIVKPILAFDKEYGGDLFQTAQIYVRLGGNITEISETMHLHKNTVRYRMKKIKEILRVDEDASIDDWLSVAFRTYEINEDWPKSPAAPE